VEVLRALRGWRCREMGMDMMDTMNRMDIMDRMGGIGTMESMGGADEIVGGAVG
jgi:hypothetical protein